jgi:hypothetical protein
MKGNIIIESTTYDEFVKVFEQKKNEFITITQSPFIRQSIFLAKPLPKEDWELEREISKPKTK